MIAQIFTAFFRAIFKIIAAAVVICVGLPLVAIGAAGGAMLFAGIAAIVGVIVGLIVLAIGTALIADAAGGGMLGVVTAVLKSESTDDAKTKAKVSQFSRGAA